MHSRIKPEYRTVTAKHEITVTINRTTVSVNVRQESIDAELQECSPRKQSRATPLEHIYWGMTPHRSSSGTRLWAGWTKEFRTPGKKYG
jgi:hypothetical protein